MVQILYTYAGRYGSLLVGCAFFAFMAFMFLFTIFFGKIDWRGQAVRLPVRLTSAEGLRPGVLVFMHGVEVGSVRSLHYMTLDDAGRPRSWAAEKESRSSGQTVIAILNLRRDLPYYPNYEVITRYQTILSEKVVEVLPGSVYGPMPYGRARAPQYGPEGTPLDPLNVLTLSNREAQHFERTGELPDNRGEMLRASNYDDPLYLIASVIVENRRPLKQITGNLRDITAKLNEGNRNIALLVNRARLMDGTNEFLRDVIVLTQELRDGVEDTRESRAAIDFLDALLAVSGAFY